MFVSHSGELDLLGYGTVTKTPMPAANEFDMLDSVLRGGGATQPQVQAKTGNEKEDIMALFG